MRRNDYSQKRETFIHKQTDKLNSQIDKAQKRLLDLILAYFIANLKTDENGTLLSDDKLIFLPARMDNAYDDFLSNEVKPIIESFSSNVNKLIGYNKKYYDGIEKSENHSKIKEQVLSAIGISGSVVLGGSLLYSILSNRDVISTIKGLVVSSITGNSSITALKISVEEILTKKDGGLLKNLFSETLSDPYVKLDRFIGGKYAEDLGLNYFIYQGGLIKTSRPFCIERNNKVFSREEIMKFGTPYDKFGGYSNKSTGEFDGKKEPYNPFIDCGGWNCRHMLDGISNELAFHLRPELRGKQLDNPVNPQLN